MNILGKSVTELLQDLKRGDYSPEELYHYFAETIARIDKNLNSFLTVVYDHSHLESRSSGSLYGIPIAVKDNFCTRELRTTAASKVLDNFTPVYESTVTKRLKEAGALVLGKTNLDAWAHGSSTETSDYGPTKNPFDTSRVPGGSSGGSAAAVAAYLVPASIGSETAGSIRLPAAWCGVVGLKPTYGRVSRYGVVAMGSSWDCPGPMTRNVQDAALLLQVMAGFDPYDATASDKPVGNYLESIEKKKAYTIGITDEYFDGVEEEIAKKISDCIDIFKKMGHQIKKIKLIHPKYAISVYTILQRAEVSSNLSRYDGIRYGNNRSYLGSEAKRRIMLGTYTLSHGYYDAYYKKAEKVRSLIQTDFENVFNDVDLIVAPATPVSAVKLGDWEKYPFFGETMDVLDEPASAAGIPAISIPVGIDSQGMPIGMQIMGRHFDEETILNLAYQFERETNFFDVREKAIEKYKD